MKLRSRLALAALALAAPGRQAPDASGRAVGLAAAARVGVATAAGDAVRLRRSRQGRRQQPVEYWDYSDNGASWKMGKCSASSGQSPIDISKVAAQQGSSDVLFHSYAVLQQPMTLRNDGRALLMSLPGGVGGISLGADTWDAYQIVVHAPSEHTFGGSRAALELQIYHAKAGTVNGQAPRADDTAIAAVGFVASVQTSLFLDSLRQGGLPTQVGAQRMVNKQAPAKLDFGSLFTGGTFLQYTGSLTAPPCSPGVQWFVRSTPLPATVAALDDFKQAIAVMASLKQATPGNARSLQPSGGISVVTRTTQAVAHPGLPQGDLVDPEFDEAVAEAAGEQRSFEKSMESGAKESPQEVAYQGCVQDLLQASNAQKAAEAQRKVECDALAEAKRQLQSAGAGVTRLQALNRVQAQEQLCNSNTQVASRLAAEAQALQQQCQQMKPR